MRYAPEQRAETHDRIVDEAGRAFRREGLGGVGIAELMRRIGLTHGGFYAHFPSKEALIAEACARSADRNSELLWQTAAKAPDGEGEALRAIIGRYVSRSHRDHPDAGCIIPSLGADVSRQPPEVRSSVTATIKRYLGKLASYLPSARRSKRKQLDDDVLVLAANMIGAVMLARAVDDPDLSDRILRVCRERLGRDFVKSS